MIMDYACESRLIGACSTRILALSEPSGNLDSVQRYVDLCKCSETTDALTRFEGLER